MKRCKHKHVEARIWSRHWHHWIVVVGPDYRGTIDALICRDCGEWLSLGPSNDEPEAVRVEMRAATLYACANDCAEKASRRAIESCVCFVPEAKLRPLNAEENAVDLYHSMFYARHQ